MFSLYSDSDPGTSMTHSVLALIQGKVTHVNIHLTDGAAAKAVVGCCQHVTREHPEDRPFYSVEIDAGDHRLAFFADTVDDLLYFASLIQQGAMKALGATPPAVVAAGDAACQAVAEIEEAEYETLGLSDATLGRGGA